MMDIYQSQASQNTIDYPKISGWVKRQIQSKNAECQIQQKAVNVCTNPNCDLENPFICKNLECQCSASHYQCTTSNLDYVLSKLKVNYDPQQIFQDSIEKAIDSLIKQLTAAKEYFIKKIRLKKANQSISYEIQSQRKQLRILMNQQPTGRNISKLLKIKNRSELTKAINNKVQFIEATLQNFKQTKLDPLIDHVKKLLFDSGQTLQKNLQFSVQIPQIDKNSSGTINTNANKYQFYIQSYTPSIAYNKFARSGVMKCQFEIIQANEILIGIGLQEKLKKKNFKIGGHPEKYGCFLNTSTGKLYLTGNDKNSQILDDGIKFSSGDFGEIQVDLKNMTLRFDNLTREAHRLVDITYLPQIEVDKYNFCVGLKNSKDKVTLKSVL